MKHATKVSTHKATTESTQTDGHHLQQSISIGMNEDIRHLQNRIRELENKINLEPIAFNRRTSNQSKLHFQRNSVATQSASDTDAALATLTTRNEPNEERHYLCYEADAIITEDLDDDERSSIKFLSARRQTAELLNHREAKAARRTNTVATSLADVDIDPNANDT